MNQVSMMHEPSLWDHGVCAYGGPARLSFTAWLSLHADLDPESTLVMTMANEWMQIIDYVAYEI